MLVFFIQSSLLKLVIITEFFKLHFVKVVTSALKLHVYICYNSPVLNGRLPCWEENSCSPVSTWKLSFWDNPGFHTSISEFFQVNHTFWKLDMKVLVTSNKRRYVRSSWDLPFSWAVDPCQQKHFLFFYYWKKRRKWVWYMVCNF